MNEQDEGAKVLGMDQLLRDAIPPADPASWTPKAPPLTREMFRAAIEKMMNQPVRICGLTEPHVLHPHHWRDGGWGFCGNCMMPVECEPGGKVVIARPGDPHEWASTPRESTD